jgi:hypothetical protein
MHRNGSFWRTTEELHNLLVCLLASTREQYMLFVKPRKQKKSKSGGGESNSIELITSLAKKSISKS